MLKVCCTSYSMKALFIIFAGMIFIVILHDIEGRSSRELCDCWGFKWGKRGKGGGEIRKKIKQMLLLTFSCVSHKGRGEVLNVQLIDYFLIHF